MERLSRRGVLAGAGSAAVGLLAGCTGGSAPGGDGGAATATDADPALDPPVRGDPDAAVTLAVYEDFGCPHCRDYTVEGYPDLADYVADGRIRYEHRDLPIPVLEPESYEAASAARAVQQRHGDEAFWAYAAELFARQDALGSETPALYATVATELGYDGEAVRTAAVERSHEATVAADRERGVGAGVEGTPGFVVDGEVVANGFGEGTVEAVAGALDERLADAAGGDGS